MPITRGRMMYFLLGAAWIAVVAGGLSRLWTYESAPGISARPPLTWPTETRLSRPAGLPTLVLLVHPKCPCSRATIGELAKLMTDCRGKLAASVLMIRPDAFAEGWERTDLWDSAAAIPGVAVTSDVGGAESGRFGAATSGQALLYGTDGRLLFAGGITESRGHRGDNAGRAAVTALVLGTDAKTRPIAGTQLAAGAPQPAHASVFGCPLFNEASLALTERNPACRSK